MLIPILIILLILSAGIFYITKRIMRRGGLPVLMYHKIINEGKTDYLSLHVDMLDKQFSYLKTNGYNTISLSQLQAYIRVGTPLPAKPCLITFDDGYRDNYTLMFPLLRKYGLKANIFLVAGFLLADKKDFLQIEEIKIMARNNVEFGLHSYDHDSYNKMSLKEMEKDIEQCIGVFKKNEIDYVSCLAYTYGAFPKRDKLKRKAMFHLFELLGITMAFRIGNRLNRMPFAEKFLIQRLDVRGDEPFEQFVKSLTVGKKFF